MSKLTEFIPPEAFSDTKRKIAAEVWNRRHEIIELSHRIHENPEPAFKEASASMWLAETLRRYGYRVDHPAGRLSTAVRGILEGGRVSEGPRIGILAEYDALPGLGHGCGHNLIAAAGVGAAMALSEFMSDLSGSVVFLGTPAEESGSGKQIMIEDGLFSDLDVALLFHPSDKNHAETHALASEEIDVTFIGVEAHAAADPWKGRNALDALILLFNAIAMWRQQLEPDARVHGIIVDGGIAPNIIPAKTTARFMIRSSSKYGLEKMRNQFRAMVEAEASATGCKNKVLFSNYTAPMKNNYIIVERFAAHMAAYGISNEPPDAQVGSTDMGNVSQVCPAIHPNLAICDRGVSKHTIQFRDLALGARSDEIVLLAATLIAQVGYELLGDIKLVEQAWREFRETP